MSEALEYIGMARMGDDGTISLKLCAEAEDGSIGHAVLTYTPDDEQYKKLIKHLGGLKKGQEKAVPPWGDDG